MYVAEIKRSNPQLALAELRGVGMVTETQEGVALCRSLQVKEHLAMTHRVTELLATTTPGDVVNALASLDLDFDGSFRVRVSRIDDTVTPEGAEDLERSVGRAIHERGYAVDLETPDHEFRVVCTEGTCYFGRLVTETRGFERRAPTEKPFFKPGSMSPMLARALTNIAGGYDDAVLLDPLCGTGGVLVEAGLAGARVLGTDSQHEMVEGARRNLREYLDDGWNLAVGDAGSMPFISGSVDCAVTDLPYGRASRVEAESADALMMDVLAELERVVRGRVVVVSDHSIRDEAERMGFLVVEALEERVHRSLTRKIHVLSPGSRPR